MTPSQARTRSGTSTAGAVVARLRLRAQGISSALATTPEAVVARLGAMQAQDYPGALWSIALRMANASRADVEHAIAERTIIRTWPMRGTLHFVPAADARWMLELTAPRIIKGAAGRHRQLELDESAFHRSRKIIGGALARDPVMTRKAIFTALERGGVSPAGQRGIHILQQLCMERMLCYGPHTEKQPTFVLFDEWIPRPRTLEREEALCTLAVRYYSSHGPATLRDFVWWTQLTVNDAKRAVHLAQPSLARLDIDGTDYWMGEDDVPSGDGGLEAHLLPGFDEFMLGYRDRSAALAARYADRIVPGANGMFLSTLVLDGQVRGTWRRRATAQSATIEATPFTRLTRAERDAFGAPAGRYAKFLGSPVTLNWAR